ncbi:MAG TPA: hypothetical protein VM791_16200 [Vicinamibacterales bacterium]|nr:hypothetical protein [Vicinamibacterales bacterium]
MRRTLLVLLVPLLIGAAIAGSRQKFYPDDPLWVDPETQDASTAKPIDISERYDFVENTFLGAGDKTPRRAVNVNTVDEVPDSSWFTNRIGREAWTSERIARGPDTGTGPLPGAWTVIAAKMEGITPGLTVRDKAENVYFIKFDPPSNPEMASGAEVIATKFLYAAGYHTPENYTATVRREQLTIAPDTQAADEDGRLHPMRARDIDDLLERAARNADGSYRVLASKALPGRPLGPFRYYGTRPDDPNDIYPHEHRRELRGLLVFAAWLNHDDSRSVNTLDTLVHDGSRSLVRHHLIDFGSTLGSGSVRAQTTRAGNEFIWEARPTFITMMTLGLYVRPWVKVDYPEIPAVGRIESTYFRPENWKPEYPNPAFRNARAEDRFWAARILSRFSDDDVRAVVAAAKYTDARATDYLVETLLARKAKVLGAWLNGTNPVINVSMSQSGEMRFQNAAEEVGVAKAADRYAVAWSRFDNTTGALTPVGTAQTITSPSTPAPPELLSERFIAATISAFNHDQPAWQDPVVVYFRRAADGKWSLVGLERNAEH